MPGGDKTGPEGKGPMTGGQRGFCTGNETAGYVGNAGTGGRNFGFRNRGGRRWRGSGQRGFRNMFNQTGKPFWMRYEEKKSNTNNGEEEK